MMIFGVKYKDGDENSLTWKFSVRIRCFMVCQSFIAFFVILSKTTLEINGFTIDCVASFMR